MYRLGINEQETCARMLNWRGKGFKVLKSTMTTIPTNHMKIFCRTAHRKLHSQSKFTLKTSETKSNCAKEYSTGKKLASKSWNWWWQQSQKYMYGNILSRRVSDLNSFFELIFAYLRGCHIGVCHAYLAAGLPCFVVLNVSFDEAFKTYHYAIVSTR